jgi:hypothetical protein
MVHMSAQPAIENLFAHAASFVKANEPSIRFEIVKFQPEPIDAQENGHSGNCCPFVSIDNG